MISSPFPGMDPYLEGYLWSDVHHALASEIRRQIAPLIQPRYTARLAITTFHETLSDDESSIFLPDIEVLTHVNSPWNKQTRDDMAGEALGEDLRGEGHAVAKHRHRTQDEAKLGGALAPREAQRGASDGPGHPTTRALGQAAVADPEDLILHCTSWGPTAAMNASSSRWPRGCTCHSDTPTAAGPDGGGRGEDKRQREGEAKR